MKFIVEVIREVEVELDEAKFSEKFMDEFRQSFYQFNSLEEHAMHLAQIEARELYGLNPDPFVEGYGHLSDAGVWMEVMDTYMFIRPEE